MFRQWFALACTLSRVEARAIAFKKIEIEIEIAIVVVVVIVRTAAIRSQTTGCLSAFDRL
jgi:hypothetical protein